MIREKLIFKVDYESIPPATFHPLNLKGSQLYFAKNTATPSLWNDQSTNAYDLSQGVATQQPIISANSVDFDGVNDTLIRNISNPFYSDTLGTFMFSGIYNNAGVNRIFASGDIAGLNRWLAFSIVSGKVGFYWNQAGTQQNITLDTTTLTNGQYYYVIIQSDNSTFTGSVNGVAQTITGTNNGTWFNSIGNRDNLSIGSLIRSTTLYGFARVNKIYYNNTVLSPTNLTKLNTFFSDPNNY